MLKKQAGFTLVELMVTMVVFTLTIVAAANIFVGILGQFKQQTKIAETNIEGLIGLQMMKTDIEQAGFGLPWNLADLTYQEADNTQATQTPWNDALYNDAPANSPRAIAFGSGDVAPLNGVTLNNSDVLIIKATSVGSAIASQRWSYITNTGANNNPPVIWSPDTPNDNPVNGDNVTAVKPVSGTRLRELVGPIGGAVGTAFNTSLAGFDNAYEPAAGSYETHLLYGINGGGTLRMPFNRADYYVRNPGGAKPTQCSQDAGTGVLYKALVNHADGGLTELPILDCVREIKVIFGRDTNEDGAADDFTPPPLTLTAEEVRNQIKEVRVYILAHEGQRDPGYQSDPTITATDPDVGTVISFNAAGAGLRNFRWKIYTIATKPYSMR